MHRAPCLLALAFLLPLQAVAQDPIADPVEPLLQSLSLQQKAGQLFMAWSLSRADGDNHTELLARVREAGLGGVILSLGTTAEAAALVPRLQAAAEVPLLLAGDFEGGVWFRLQGATELGTQMLVGATGSAQLAEAMGRVAAEEAKALGFHWIFAPVLDVNSNPDNPIINVRSFGEDPERVARLGVGFARGVRSAGLLACGKHFPGHGDVDSDSHLALPTVPGSAERLRAVELRPFAAAAAAGIDSVMTGHLAVPGLGEDPALPATLSRRILHDVLRDELGFTGLVVTDALEMKGISNALPPGEVAVRALLAGADVLLMPPDPLLARAAVEDAVVAGRVPMARLDDAVRRILTAKARVGLLSGGGGVAADWPAQMRSAAAEATADVIAARGITLVRDRDGGLPMSPAARGAALLVTLLDRDDGQLAAFGDELGVAAAARVRLAFESPTEVIAAAAQRVAAATVVVLALDVRVRENHGSLGLPPSLQPVLDALGEDQQVIAVSFGDPYVGRVLPRADAYVCAFGSTERVARRVAQALCGSAPFLGRLPVGIPGVGVVGEGCTQLVGSEVPRGEPIEHDLVADLSDRLRAVLSVAVEDRAFPGAVCIVARAGVQVAAAAVGRESYDDGAAVVRLDTVYDLASLTKVCATLPAVLSLVASGTLSLDDPVAKWLPAFVGIGKERVTVRHLLAHTSGLPAYERYHRTLRGKAAIVAAAADEALLHEPGTAVVYSDLGFLLLMAVVEACSGEPFPTFVQRAVFTPLGMRGATFGAIDGPPLAAAPTELDPARGGLVRGHVHDENAFAMGGVSGHAGLFATAEDVLRLGITMLAGGRGVLPRTLVTSALRPAASIGATARGLAFELPTAGGWGGTQLAAGTFGHTGFTGTSLWCDPRHDLCVVLLTNRVHPTRVNGKIVGVRRALHDLVLESLR